MKKGETNEKKKHGKKLKKKTKMKKHEKETREKKKAQWSTSRDGPKKLIFHLRALKGNREAMEAKKKKDFEHLRNNNETTMKQQ